MLNNVKLVNKSTEMPWEKQMRDRGGVIGKKETRCY